MDTKLPKLALQNYAMSKNSFVVRSQDDWGHALTEDEARTVIDIVEVRYPELVELVGELLESHTALARRKGQLIIGSNHGELLDAATGRFLLATAKASKALKKAEVGK